MIKFFLALAHAYSNARKIEQIKTEIGHLQPVGVAGKIQKILAWQSQFKSYNIPMNDHVIVYRSEFEKLQDEFWMDFINNNAGTLYFLFVLAFWCLVAFVILRVIFRFIPSKRTSKWEEKRNRRRF